MTFVTSELVECVGVADTDTLTHALARNDATLALAAIEEVVAGVRSLRETADAFAAHRPLFNHSSEYATVLPFYETVERSLCPLLERGDGARLQCRQHLALALAVVGRMDDAERIRREVWVELAATRPPDDPERVSALAEVAAALSARGARSEANALYSEVPICEHLRPVREELLRSGARQTTAGYLWGAGRISIWFDLVLDPRVLHERLGLDPCVVPTENDDARTGPELGLACTVHLDSIVGPHPKFVG
jgi:hypothetical protein